MSSETLDIIGKERNFKKNQENVWNTFRRAIFLETNNSL